MLAEFSALLKTGPLLIKLPLLLQDPFSLMRGSGDKHKKNYPWLTCTCVVMIYEVVQVFAAISIDDAHQHVLSSGQSLQPVVR